jgi:hypothetical protein
MRRRPRRRVLGCPRSALLVGALGLVLAAAAPGVAPAAQLIGRNASQVRLAVNGKGEAMLTFRSGGVLKRVLVWGAVNARAPSPGGPQVRFKVDYSGGWIRYRTLYWQRFGSCGRYDGPRLPNLVAACKAPNRTYWAAQSWPQPLPNLGFTPWLGAQRSTWLEVSHWSGPVATLETGTAWLRGSRSETVFGRVTYGGRPVYGFHMTRRGAPTDGFGRLVYLDTYNSAYGRGWRRENSFVTHRPTGVFCYGFFKSVAARVPHPPGKSAARGPGFGEKYRVTASGPGVTPNVAAIVPGLRLHRANPTDLAWQREQTQRLLSWRDPVCSAAVR